MKKEEAESLRKSAVDLLEMLDRVMPRLDPLKNPRHPGWKAIEEIERIIKECGGGEPSDRHVWTVLHAHRHGNSIYVVESDHQPSEEELVKQLGIDFEPDRDETIDVDGPMPIIKIDKEGLENETEAEA